MGTSAQPIPQRITVESDDRVHLLPACTSYAGRSSIATCQTPKNNKKVKANAHTMAMSPPSLPILLIYDKVSNIETAQSRHLSRQDMHLPDGTGMPR
jgi:hypothetical protein